jgi:plastocyanin
VRIYKARHSFQFLLAAAVFASACSEPAGPPEQPPFTPIDAAQAGSIRVTVRYDGPVPDPVEVNMRSAGGCANLHPEPVFEHAIKAPGGRLSEALVYIKSGFGDRTFEFPAAPVVIDQRGCQYHPSVAALMIGQPLEFHNSDPEAHNVRGRPESLKGWNFMMSRPKSSRTLYFDKPEIGIAVGCDVHPWMHATVSVLGNPYFGVSGDQGVVSLDRVPPGDYVIGVWHKKLGALEQSVTLEASGSKELKLEFPPG